MHALRERIEAGSIPEPNSGCWLWERGSIKHGYGVMRLGPDETSLVHRASWRAYRGPIPAGAAVLHRCDTPPCVNPAHLFLGTQLDNIRDRDAKGRTARGEKLSRLTEAAVITIRERYAAGETQERLGAAFGVSAHQIGCIISRQSWAAVGA